MSEPTDTTTGSVFGLPAWILWRRQARFAFLVVGAWTCGFACVSMLTVFHAGLGAWASEFESVLLFASIGGGLGLVLAVPILWRTEVRKSVPFVWASSVVMMALAILFENQLSRSSALLWIPWIAMAAWMLVARRCFALPRELATRGDTTQ